MKGKIIPIALGIFLCGVAVAILAVFIRAKARHDEPLREYRTVGNFQLTERSGRTISTADLHGKIVVVDFFFGACSAQCQVLSQHMAEVQRLTDGMNDVLLVSITVDPRADTPEALTRYATRFNASTNRWLFLTGDKKLIYPLIQESFLQPVAQADAPPDPFGGGFIHSEKIALVDRRGTVRAYYEGMESTVAAKILRGIQQLRNESALNEN
ncbi:MAG: hypothetical protein ABS95_03005 [Verrucomicrobia bacterium SCN 57-15]|nr:MAG: hypothetical protein ABS95_03005 [Verrucomicrobia bacterium SCN 57-15]